MENKLKNYRDPNRIKPFLEKLEKLWNTKGTDQLRFGQLIICLLSGRCEEVKIWNFEEEQWSKLMDEWIEKNKEDENESANTK
jgi:hypothetical protein